MIRPEYIVEELSRYMPDADCDMVWRAYAFASKGHKGQKVIQVIRVARVTRLTRGAWS